MHPAQDYRFHSRRGRVQISIKRDTQPNGQELHSSQLGNAAFTHKNMYVHVHAGRHLNSLENQKIFH